ncbi:hypothetical protein NC796_16515 [Aliifodinibius sp. S!AR15-10]|nr:hypothetical protein [Aliifodinibius sp. S!AR15-10]MDR8392760.1 hypothetical protein [Aliifodinibius sp. S!AR15-10]
MADSGSEGSSFSISLQDLIPGSFYTIIRQEQTFLDRIQRVVDEKADV